MTACACGCGQQVERTYAKGHNRRRSGLPAEERFWAKVDRRGPDECWPWLASKNRFGYGMFDHGFAYSFARELLFGPLPVDPPEDGTHWTVDHTCHDPETCAGGATCPHRACVNPNHLEIVSARDNTLRGGAPAAVNARKTHCKRGHEFTAANTYEWRGHRRCRTCQEISRA